MSKARVRTGIPPDPQTVTLPETRRKMSGRKVASEGGCRAYSSLERLAAWICEKGLRAPAILFLEAHKPLAPLGSQALLLLQPLLGDVGGLLGWGDGERVIEECALLLEDPEGVERLLACLESVTTQSKEG